MASSPIKPLPYAHYALEPHIDALTVNIHHTKHQMAFINELRAVIEEHPELRGLDATAICKAIGSGRLTGKAAEAARFPAGAQWNHSFFWSVLCAPSDSVVAIPSHSHPPTGELAAAIDAAFGSLEGLKVRFSTTAIEWRGSGWVWLGVKPDGGLAIAATPNEDNPLMAPESERIIPILGLDLWEHAYYLKHHNRKHEYTAAFWLIADWSAVAGNYAAAKEGRVYSA
ncbi:manganese superoxide dismutase [Raphidocelis subcapitata]|uniref:Superoxide dismutase n=1 Tax=Raphidocelis subcapitata TaxID=307507 RepID=A0A2V0NSS6_9CHLO|nr:manganese superoxide dismutase [Raphidocelis subcapitata]|eukprot:GBF90686.1 manganese superoxide dismutase [Raphidocelis subcapitata]